MLLCKSLSTLHYFIYYTAVCLHFLLITLTAEVFAPLLFRKNCQVLKKIKQICHGEKKCNLKSPEALHSMHCVLVSRNS